MGHSFTEALEMQGTKALCYISQCYTHLWVVERPAEARRRLTLSHVSICLWTAQRGTGPRCVKDFRSACSLPFLFSVAVYRTEGTSSDHRICILSARKEKDNTRHTPSAARNLPRRRSHLHPKAESESPASCWGWSRLLSLYRAAVNSAINQPPAAGC